MQYIIVYYYGGTAAVRLFRDDSIMCCEFIIWNKCSLNLIYVVLI